MAQVCGKCSHVNPPEAVYCYWDGADRPAVSAPLGDFYGTGLGRLAPFQSALFTNPEGRSFNSFVPMPFRTGMRIVSRCLRMVSTFFSCCRRPG